MARISTVRQVRAALKAWKKPVLGDLGDDDDPPRMITRNATWDEKVWFLGSIMRLDRVAGRRLEGPQLVEAILAEVEFYVLGKAPEPEKAFDDDGLARAIISREENLEERLAAEARVEPKLPQRPEIEVLPEPQIPLSPFALDRFIADVAGTLAGLDLEVARLAKDIIEDGGWKRLGYASRQQYAAERAAVSLKTFENRRRLGRRIEVMPEVGEAVRARKLGLTVATMITQVADSKTASHWVARSQRRTVKHLEEEIEAARAFDRKAPPEDELVEKLFEMRREAIGLLDTGSNRKMSAVPPLEGTTQVRLPATESWHERWCRIEAMWRAMGSPLGSFLMFCSWCIWDSHPPEEIDLKYLAIYLRDRWECTSPVCTSTNLTPHHPHRRSQGGSDEERNVVSGCPVCHLVLIHTLCSLYVTGRAPDRLTWTIGPAEAGFIVQGREVVRAKAA